MNIRLEKSATFLNDIKNLYKTAFPENERCDFDYLLNERYSDYEMFAITKENDFVGFIFVAFYKDIVYVNYFAIREEFRNCGFGSMALGLLKEKFKDFNILLSIEKPISQAQKRRLKFYQKNNFFVTGFELKNRNTPFQVLCYGKFEKQVLLQFFDTYFPNAEYCT